MGRYQPCTSSFLSYAGVPFSDRSSLHVYPCSFLQLANITVKQDM